MERMGFECLALDQDEVALSIAQSLKVDWRALAAPLPIAPGEVSGQGMSRFLVSPPVSFTSARKLNM